MEVRDRQHLGLTGFEPPVTGPGPVRNKSRLPNGVANFQMLVGDYANPILKPEAAQAVKKHGEISLAGQVTSTLNVNLGADSEKHSPCAADQMLRTLSLPPLASRRPSGDQDSPHT